MNDYKKYCGLLIDLIWKNYTRCEATNWPEEDVDLVIGIERELKDE